MQTLFTNARIRFMNLFYKIAKWFQKRYFLLTAVKYKVTAVNKYPKNINTETIYVVTDGPIPDTLIFKCPCGCDVDIYLNLLKDTRPNWSFYITPKGKITISPSIWRNVGCKSHFIVRTGKIFWCS